MELLKLMFRFIVRLIAVHIVVYSVAIFGPVLFVLPFVLIYQNPTADYKWLALTLFWIMPISAGFYTNLTWHLMSVRQWKREGGQPWKWVADNGGVFRTGARSIAIMFGAMFLSYFCETLFVYAYGCVNVSGVKSVIGTFALMPFATFAPVILLWLHRWMANFQQPMALRHSEGL